MKKISRWVPAFAGMTSLLLAAFAIASDGTVGKTVRERFMVDDVYGRARTACKQSLFAASAMRDGAAIAISPAFKNYTTGVYEMDWTPAEAGEYAGFVSYSGVQALPWEKTVRDYDTDTVYAGLSATLGSPMQTSGYTAPDNAGIAAIKARTDSLPDNPAATGDQMTLTSAYDAAKYSSSQASVDGLGTPAQSSDLASHDTSVKSAIADAHAATDTLVGNIDGALTATHGTGLWSAAGSVTVVPFQGTVSHETAARSADVHVVRGDSAAVPYSAGADLTGWEVWFGAKANPADGSYAVPLREITSYVTDPATGGGLINLAPSDTDVTPRRYYAEIELRKEGYVNTPLRFFLWIDADVIR